ncbi:MAG TPA: YkgJ family cysteine cluster protein [Planctomycetota bacterium]|nr:YkgJ family cysteine cluster protein [Planctomycetota bacterium]
MDQASRPRPEPGGPWYAAGLAFECQRCRKCCGGEPGYVWIDETELGRLAAEMGLNPQHFRSAYCRKVFGRISLRERADGDCVLLGPEGCTVYASRPLQCRTFPFWPEHVESPEAWERLAQSCPGVNRGRVHPAGEIEAAKAGRPGAG